MSEPPREPQLGREIRRLRLQSAITLRGLAVLLGISAAHLSDIEHDRRRPSEPLLREIAYELRAVGASFESFHELITGVDPETRDWMATTPGVRNLLLKVRESGKDPQEILPILEKTLGRKGTPVKTIRNTAVKSPRKTALKSPRKIAPKAKKDRKVIARRAARPSTVEAKRKLLG